MVVLSRNRKRKSIIRHWIALSVFILIALFPFYWMFLTSMRPNAEIYATKPSLLLNSITFKHYLDLLTTTNFPNYMANSLIVAVSAMSVAICISFPAAFALTSLRMRGREFIARMVLFSYLVPTSLLFIPMFTLIGRLGLSNTLHGLILTYLTFTVPFVTWLMIGYLKTVPIDLMESAQIDGCSKIAAMIKIILPMTAPGLAAAAIFAFTLAWNEFTYALVFISSDIKRTIPVGISGLIMGDVYEWGMIMSSAVLASIPAVALYVLAQKFVVQGLTAGGVKG